MRELRWVVISVGHGHGARCQPRIDLPQSGEHRDAAIAIDESKTCIRTANQTKSSALMRRSSAK